MRYLISREIKAFTAAGESLRMGVKAAGESLRTGVKGGQL